MNTPFDALGRLDDDSLRREVDVIRGAGCSGVLMLASAGEGELLTLPEFSQALHTVTTHAGDDLPVLVSIAAADQAGQLARAERAVDAGAQGVLVPVPRVPTHDERIHLLGEVAERAPAIVALQDLDPGGDGLAVEHLVAIVTAIQSVRMLKIETVPAGPKFTALRQQLGPTIHLSGGWTVLQLMDALDRGVDAFIPTEMEEAYVAIWELHRAGAVEEARALWEQLLPILAFSNQSIDVSIRLLKRFRVARGTFATDRCRIAGPALDRYQLAEADRLWARYGSIRSALPTPRSAP